MLNTEEQIVLDLISNTPNRITQQDIAKSQRWLGSHPKYETERQETTLRKIRQIIRDLRIKHYYMILSDAKGYWMMRDKNEAIEYCNRIERMAKSQAKAWFETYNAMKKNFGLKSQYFDQQGELF